MRNFARNGMAIMLALMTGCGSGDNAPEADLGPIDEVLDDLTKTVWPGVIGVGGERHVRLINGFFDGEPTAYWFSGFAPRFTAELFWFCREGDAACPLAPDGSVDPSATVGRPVFARMPGEQGYSPYWAVRVVRVPDDYEPDAIKSVLGIEAAVAAGRATVEPLQIDHGGDIGVAEVITHCLLVLDGTALEGNGADLVSAPGVPTQRILLGEGWHKRYQVSFYDFTAAEGALAPDPESEAIPLMPAADIFVMFRDCAGGSTAPLCDAASAEFPSVSERGVEHDFTDDGDKSDTNNLLAAIPGELPADPNDRSYSPLWAVNVVRVRSERDADVRLIDTSGDQSDSDIASVAEMRAAIAAGLLDPSEPMSEAQAGNSIAGNGGDVFFNCPSQVPAP